MEKPQMDLTRDQKIARQSSELRALREQQIAEASGESEAETVPGNRNPKFKIKVIESQAYVHVFTRVKNLSQDQKDFVNDDRVIAIHAREFDKRVKDGAFATYDEVEVVHDPRKGAPKAYALKPEQLDVNAAAKSSAAPAAKGDDKEIARAKQQIEKETERLGKIREIQNDREKELADKEAALAAREKALAEAEANKPAPSAPVAEQKAETKKAPEVKAEEKK